MKKVVFLIFLLCSVCFVSAKDIIVLKNAEVVEAKILEVSSTEIKYKRLNNLNGPTFSVNISEVSTVVYENGDVESFAKKEQVGGNLTEKNAAQGSVSADSKSNVKVKSNSNSGKVLYPISVGRLGYEMNGKLMVRRDLEAYLKRNCASAYNKWMEGRMKSVAGWTFLGCGITCCIVSIATGVRYADSNYTNDVAGSLQATCLILGISSDIASIPFLAGGYKSKRKAIELYNGKCATKGSSFDVRVNLKGNGLGLSMMF